jgi:hypothetical protein
VELDARFGRHYIDRFASALNTLLPRYNVGWDDPTCEAAGALRLSDSVWRKENNGCNPPWPLLPNRFQKLQQSGVTTNGIAPIWTGKVWRHALNEMASEELIVAPRQNLFRSGRRALRGLIGSPHWAVTIFQVPPGQALLKTRTCERSVGSFCRTTPRPLNSRLTARVSFQAEVESQRHFQ